MPLPHAHTRWPINVVLPIEHDALSAAVGNAIAHSQNIDVDEASHIARTHMALVDMIRDTLVTLSQKRAELHPSDHAGIAQFNNRIASSLRDLNDAVYDPANAVLQRTVRIQLSQ